MAIGTWCLGATNIPEIGFLLGEFMWPVVAVYSFLAQANTQPETCGSSSIQWANIFNTTKVRTVIPLVVLQIIGAHILYFTVGLGIIASWVEILASALPPLAGVMIADYWLVKRRKYPALTEIKEKVRIESFIAWIIGAIIGYWTITQMSLHPEAMFEYGIPGVNGIIVALVIHYILAKLIRR